MPPHLVQFLLGGQACVVATVDEKHRPMTTLMTWVVARNPQTLTMAVDTRGKALRNIRHNPHVAVEVLGDDLCYGLRGTAVIAKGLFEGGALFRAAVAGCVEECLRHSPGGVKFLRYHRTDHRGQEPRPRGETAR